jgi:hypothetical protein
MIRLRKECPEIGLGRCSVVNCGVPNVLGLRYDWRGNIVITLHNFDDRPHRALLRLPDRGVDRLSNLMADGLKTDEARFAANDRDNRRYGRCRPCAGARFRGARSPRWIDRVLQRGIGGGGA